MALTQEEIKIKAGLDYSSVTAGLNSIGTQVNKLASGVPAMLNSMLRTNLVGIGLSLIKDALPTWDEFWSGVYGDNSQTAAKAEAAAKRLTDLAAKSKAALKDLEDTAKKIRFENSDEQNKQFQLIGDERELAKQESQLRKNIKGWTDFRATLKATMGEGDMFQGESLKITENLKRMEAELLGIQKQRLIVVDKINDITKKMNEARGPVAKPKEQMTMEHLSMANSLEPLYGRAFAIGHQLRARSMGNFINYTQPQPAPAGPSAAQPVTIEQVVKVSIVEIK